MSIHKAFPLYRLKVIADIRPSGVDKHSVDGQDTVQLCNYTDVYKYPVIYGNIPFMTATASKVDIERFSLRAGDVIITKDSETAADIAVSAIVDDSASGVVCGYHLTLLRPGPSMRSNFMSWALQSREVLDQFTLRAQGVTRFGLTTHGTGEVRIPCPDSQTQSLIAKYLDRETADIDTLIAEQKKLIELSREKRAAVIAHVVTGGLDASTPNIDSGIDWIGTMPTHWSLSRLGYYASVGNGSTPDRSNASFWFEGTIPWVSSGAVNQYVVVEASDHITQDALEKSSLGVIPAAAVLVGLIGQGRTRGTSAILGIPAAINQNVAAVICSPGLSPNYLHYTLQAAYESLRQCGRGGNQAALNCEILSAFRIPIPPFSEQLKIAKHLDVVHASFLALVEQCSVAISLLQERRAALISAAVTGKIDVRRVAADSSPIQEAAE